MPISNRGSCHPARHARPHGGRTDFPGERACDGSSWLLKKSIIFPGTPIEDQVGQVLHRPREPVQLGFDRGVNIAMLNQGQGPLHAGSDEALLTLTLQAAARLRRSRREWSRFRCRASADHTIDTLAKVRPKLNLKPHMTVLLVDRAQPSSGSPFLHACLMRVSAWSKPPREPRVSVTAAR